MDLEDLGDDFNEPPLVGMHTLSYISIPLDYILHIQVFRLQDCPPSCSAAPPLPHPPRPPREGGVTGGEGQAGGGEVPEEVSVPGVRLL